MKTSLAALHQSEADPLDDGESIWPRVSVALVRTTRSSSRRPNRLNRWAPPVAVAALCLAMVSILRFSHNLESPEDRDPMSNPRVIPVSTGMPTDFLLPSRRSSDPFSTDPLRMIRDDNLWLPDPLIPETERRERQLRPRPEPEVPPLDSGSY